MQVTDLEYAEPASRMQLAKKLSHLTSYSEFIILLLGAPGSGRSTLLDQLEWQHEPRTQRIARINLTEHADVSAILQALILALGLDAEQLNDNRKRLAAVHKQLRALHDVDIALHLQIDNADFLSDNALELLLSLFQLDDMAPHLLLTATPSFEQRAEEKDIFSRFENRVHLQRLEPFTHTEAEDFVLSLLPSHVELSPKQLAKLISASNLQPGGLTATVETFIKQGGLDKNLRAFPLPPLHMTVIIGVLLLITGLAAWHYYPSAEPENQLTRIDAPIVVAPVVRDAEQDTRALLAQRLTEEEARLAIDVDSADTPLDTEIETASQPQPQVSQADRVEIEAIAAAQALVESQAQDQAQALADAQAEAEAEAQAQAVKAAQAAAQAQAEARAKAEAQTKADAQARALAEAQEQQAADATKPAETAATPAVPQAPATQAASGAQALLGWPDNGFTLQMLGARSEESVVRFIQSQPQPQRFYRFKALFQGAPWHVVVYGQYPTRAAAMEAVQSLPAELKDRKPWARSIASVKEDIRKIDQ